MINVNKKSSTSAKDGSNQQRPTVDFVTSIDNWRLMVCKNAWRPPTDIVDTSNTILIRIEIAGMKQSDFSITLDQNKLTISGSRIDKNEHGAFQQMEIQSGYFCTTIDLPRCFYPHEIGADYKNGFLTIILQK